MSKNTLTTYCVNEIRDLILKCKLLPGEKIKGEFLKNHLKVGLSPIREALFRLIGTGLVESIDNVGFKVSSVNKECLIDFYKSFAKIEVLLFTEAMEHGSEKWEADIVGALYHLSKIETVRAKVDYKTWNISNEYFHEALINGCPFNELKQIRANFILIKEWYHNLAYGQFEKELISVNHLEHSKIAELAIARKISPASTLLHQHTMHSLDSLILKLEKLGYISNG